MAPKNWKLVLLLLSAAISNSCCLALGESVGQAKALRSFLQSYVEQRDTENKSAIRYVAAFTDLEGNGVEAAIVYLESDEWCGTSGCRTLIVARRGSSYRVVKTIIVAQLPIRVSRNKSHGWHDIIFRVQGGGIAHAYDSTLTFDGTTYETGPSRPVGRADGTTLIPLNAETNPLFP